MALYSETVSFLIRFSYTPGRSAGSWRATVEHMQSGEREEFMDLESLLAFLRRHAERVPMLRPRSGEPRCDGKPLTGT